MFKALTNKDTYKKYFKDFKFAFYCVTHPLDGFWDLTHEKKGSLAVANTILIITLVVRIMMLRYVSFLFNDIYWPEVNIFRYLGSILFPLALWCVANWAETTLFDGKGKLKDIYIATVYSFIPYAVFHLPLMFLSNVVTLQEQEFISVTSTVSLVFCGILVLCAMMQIHEYTFGKTLLFTIGTILGVCIIVFIMLIFFSMISDGIGYFVSLYKEIIFRI